MPNFEITAAVRALGIDQLSKLADEAERLSGVSEGTSKALSGLSVGGVNLSGGMLKAAAGLAVVVTSAYEGTKALLAWTVEAGKAAEQSQLLADRLGISVGQAEQLSATAKIAGVNIGALEGSAKLLSAALEAGGDGAKKQVAALAGLGISTRQVTGNQRELGSVVLDVLRKLSQIPDDSKRTALAVATLGKGAIELGPLIKNFGELNDAVKKLGVGLNESGTNQLAKFDDEMDKLEISFSRLKKSLAEKIAPILIPVVRVFSDIASDNIGGKGGYSASELRALGFRGLPASAGGTPSGRDTVLGFLSENNDLLAGRTFQRSSRAVSDGSEQRLEAIKRAIAEQESILGDSGVGLSAKRAADAKIIALQAQEKAIKDQNAALEKQKQLEQEILATRLQIANATDLKQINSILNTFGSKNGPDALGRVFGPGGSARELIRIGAGPFAPLDSRRNRLSLLPGQNELQTQEIGLGIFPDIISSVTGNVEKSSQLRVASIKAQADYQAKLVELLTGPGGELQAIREIAALRLDAAEKEYRSTFDKVELDRQRLAIQRDYNLQVLAEVRRAKQENISQIRGAAGSAFDALTANGVGGLQSFGLSLVKGLQRTVVQNIAEFGFGGGSLSIPGLKKDSFFGKLLKGTPFGPKESAEVALVSSLDLNRESVDRLTATIGGGVGIPGAAGVPGVGGKGGGLIGAISGVFGGGSTSSGGSSTGFKGFLGGLGTVLSGGLFRPRGTEIISPSGVVLNLPATGAQRLGNYVGSVGAIASGAGGIYAGIQQGGLGGAATATSSALGIAALIPGPQQPFIAAAAALVGLVGLFTGRGKNTRAEQDAALIRGATRDPITGKQYSVDTYGREFDYDTTGRQRPIEVKVNIQAIDTKSFEDHAEGIGNAVARAVEMGHARVVPALREAIA